MDNNYNPNIPLETKSDINFAFDLLALSKVNAKTASIPKCEIKFNSVDSSDNNKYAQKTVISKIL
jgi:hypothetical protein